MLAGQIYESGATESANAIRTRTRKVYTSFVSLTSSTSVVIDGNTGSDARTEQTSVDRRKAPTDARRTHPCTRRR